VVEASVVVEVETDDEVVDNHSAVDEVVVDESAVGGAVIGQGHLRTVTVVNGMA